MRHYEEYKVTETRRKLVRVTCDRCDEEIPKLQLYRDREFTLEFKSGNSYPSGGHMTGWEVSDLCDDCVIWLKGLLESNGVNLCPVDVDW